MASAAELEEANRIRVSLGMQPLPVPGAAPVSGPIFKEADDGEEPASTIESRSAQGFDNWQKLEAEKAAKAKRAAKKEAIRKEVEKAARFAKLEGKGLADSEEEEELDALTWLKQQKKRQRKLEKERAKREAAEEAERKKQQVDYTAADLAGVKVGHELGEFDDGEQILTLKDTAVDVSDEDELENADLREKERREERLKLKKKKPAYNPNEADETGAILAQYDEEAKKRFTLDKQGGAQESVGLLSEGSNAKGVPVNLDILMEDAPPPSDYMDAPTFKMRKSKKGKPKTARKRVADDEGLLPADSAAAGGRDADTAMEGAGSTAGRPTKRGISDTDFLDDDELQAQLARHRQAAMKRKKVLRPEDIAKQIREGSAADSLPGVMDHGDDNEGGMVINDMKDFLENIQKEKEQPVVRKPKPKKVVVEVNSPSPYAMTPKDDAMDVDQGSPAVDDTGAPMQSVSALLAADANAEEMSNTGLKNEHTFNKGLGATLAILKDYGVLDTADTRTHEAHRARQRFLAEKAKRAEEADRNARTQREEDRRNGKLDHMTAHQREEHARKENERREKEESQEMARIFEKNYKPNVEITYHDELGRDMNPKEAFKHLSHAFHGKTSGKGKTDKKMKKITEERRQLAESTLSSIKSANDAKRQKGAGTGPGVRLQ
ncbi:hypothetical protein K402DRAFT_367953 [Aulographum hederae CBS 113979]|uniref:SART-1 protein n=1 Tax=Aulographum hederae CBS 113979 TaxID=1176131 RepID=A0A6G1HDZ8_9PEZI|nr:hypothetical protein K402DRAFT_367953 [Aulographum hederae CBS 113979]